MAAAAATTDGTVMAGASLSRWTMSYFAAALFFLLVGNGLFVVGFGYPAMPIEAPETLILVHILAIGWLGLLFSGALLQFVPVLVAKPLYAPGLAPVALILLITGLLCLVFGFMYIADYLEGGVAFLPFGGLLLAAGFGLVISMIGGTLLTGRPLGVPARFVATGIVALVATLFLGVCFTLTLSGFTSAPFLDQLLVSGVSLHVFLGLVGWMSVSTFGVSYQLLTMFLLVHEKGRWRTHAISGLMTTSVLMAVIAIPAVASGWNPAMPVYAAISIFVSASCLFIYEVVTIYRQRKRPSLELNMKMNAVATGALFLSVCLFFLLAMNGSLASHVGPLTYMVALNWLSVLGLGHLYKIVAFMTWLESYGPILGRKPVPRVQDLVNEKRASIWFFLYAGCTAVSIFALLLEMSSAFRAVSLVQMVCLTVVIVELARTRRLSYVSMSPSSDGKGAHAAPPLFLPTQFERK